jgi:hypothetical protein
MGITFDIRNYSFVTTNPFANKTKHESEQSINKIDTEKFYYIFNKTKTISKTLKVSNSNGTFDMKGFGMTSNENKSQPSKKRKLNIDEKENISLPKVCINFCFNKMIYFFKIFII